MSMRLNLVDSLFQQGQKLHKLGRAADAQQILQRLTEFRQLPSEVAEMSQAVLAEMHLKRLQFRKARRCLTAALQHRPDCARYHYLMAQAWEKDEKGDDERGIEHYERSLDLDPEQPECLSDLGLLLVEVGQVEDGLSRLRHAVKLAPTNPVFVEHLVSALRLANRSDEARSALVSARFRNPRNPRFHKLWNDFQFQELRRQQEMEKLEKVRAAADDAPVLLPFVRVVRADETEKRTPIGKILRQDRPTPAAPHGRDNRNRLPRQCL